MKDIDYSKIVKVEICHTTYHYSNVVVCDIKDYIDSINYLCSKGVKIIGIRFYEEA